VFLLNCHVIPVTDPEAGQMTAFRDLLRCDPGSPSTSSTWLFYKARPPGRSAGTAPHPGRTGPYTRRIGGRDRHGVARLPTRLLPSISLQSRNL
jgi:hypothetical protein